MTVREIVQAPNSLLAGDGFGRLSDITREVGHDDREELHRVVADLLDTMAFQPLCVGLAANQIDESLRVAVIERTDEEPLVLVNPAIVSLTGKKDKKRESCMSVWGLTADVERRTKVTVRYLDLDLREQEDTFEGFAARVVQHEIDHLDGVLYTDRSEAEPRETALFEGHSPQAPAAEV